MYKSQSLVHCCLFKVAYNGKSIGEVRDFEELNVQEFTNVANAFSMKLNYKKMWN